MMKLNSVSHLLMSNWGNKADALDCQAYVCVKDDFSRWLCYIYAMNPLDENEILCFIPWPSMECIKWTVSELSNCYNSNGESPIVDNEFRHTNIKQLIKRYSRIYES